MPQIVHPDHILNAADFAKMPPIEPVYPMTAGISPKTLGKGIRSALEHLPALKEWDEPNWRAKHNWPTFGDALNRLHLPQSVSDLELGSPARKRLAYDELLANQLALALVRRQMGLAVSLTGVRWDSVGSAVGIRPVLTVCECPLRVMSEIKPTVCASSTQPPIADQISRKADIATRLGSEYFNRLSHKPK